MPHLSCYSRGSHAVPLGVPERVPGGAEAPAVVEARRRQSQLSTPASQSIHLRAIAMLNVLVSFGLALREGGFLTIARTSSLIDTRSWDCSEGVRFFQVFRWRIQTAINGSNG